MSAKGVAPRERDAARAEGIRRRVVQARFALRHLQWMLKSGGDYLREFPQTLRSALSLHSGGVRRVGGVRHGAGSLRQGGQRVHLRRSHGRESDLCRDSQPLTLRKERQGRASCVACFEL